MPWSRVDIDYTIYRLQHTLSTVYTEFSILWVQHSQSTAYTEYSIHWVQHSLSTVYTEYSIHWVLYSPSTAYTEYCTHGVLHTLHNCIIPRLNVSRTQPVSHLSAEHILLNSLHSHNYMLTNAESVSSCCAFLPNYRHQIDAVQVFLHSCTMMASKSIFRLPRLRPSSSHDHGLQFDLQTRSITAFNFGQSWPPSA